MNNKKISGPKTDLWGTPIFISCDSDNESLILTEIPIIDKANYSIQKIPLIPLLWILILTNFISRESKARNFCGVFFKLIFYQIIIIDMKQKAKYRVYELDAGPYIKPLNICIAFSPPEPSFNTWCKITTYFPAQARAHVIIEAHSFTFNRNQQNANAL